MFEDQGHKRSFRSAPQSVTSLVAAILVPALAVALFLAVSMALDETIGRPELALCLLVFALTFPGRNGLRHLAARPANRRSAAPASGLPRGELTSHRRGTSPNSYGDINLK